MKKCGLDLHAMAINDTFYFTYYLNVYNPHFCVLL